MLSNFYCPSRKNNLAADANWDEEPISTPGRAYVQPSCAGVGNAADGTSLLASYSEVATCA